jgi:hypothetical protein
VIPGDFVADEYDRNGGPFLICQRKARPIFARIAGRTLASLAI